MRCAGRLTVTLTLLLCVITGCAAPAKDPAEVPVEAGGGQEVQVSIQNQSDESIRCVAVLAHFVTRTLPPIASGQVQAFTLVRDPTAGTLSYGSHGVHPMMLENLLCGTQSDWTASSRDLPLLTVRSDEARRFDFRCALADGVVACRP